MKKLVIMMMLLAFVGANVAIAADSYTYDNEKGTVTFDHKAHQAISLSTAPNATKASLPRLK